MFLLMRVGIQRTVNCVKCLCVLTAYEFAFLVKWLPLCIKGPSGKRHIIQRILLAEQI